VIPVHMSTFGDLTDDFDDYYDAREDDYTDRQRVRKNRRARSERRKLMEARKEVKA
jgi:hypothetical protein